MKFKVGERARIVGARSCWGVNGKLCVVRETPETNPSGKYCVEVLDWAPCDGIDSNCGDISESGLRKLLPDSDTYHPANISIDDLMRTIKTPETVI